MSSIYNNQIFPESTQRILRYSSGFPVTEYPILEIISNQAVSSELHISRKGEKHLRIFPAPPIPNRTYRSWTKVFALWSLFWVSFCRAISQDWAIVVLSDSREQFSSVLGFRLAHGHKLQRLGIVHLDAWAFNGRVEWMDIEYFFKNSFWARLNGFMVSHLDWVIGKC